MIVVILSGTICLVSLRHNNEQMVHLRDAVYVADRDNGNVESTLRDLRIYIYGHMNTSLASGPNAVHPPIQLKYTYERLQQTQESTLGEGSSALYQKAQSYCEQQTDVGSEVISCIQQYATDHGVKLTVVPDDLYKFDFTSAKWSPDLAGWSLVLTVFFFVCFLVSGAYHWLIKKYVL